MNPDPTAEAEAAEKAEAEAAEKAEAEDTAESVEAALKREESERKNAQSEKNDRDMAAAEKLDDRASKLRSQVAAQKRLEKKEKDTAKAKEKSIVKDAADKADALTERDAIAPSLNKAYDADPMAMTEEMTSEIDTLERVGLTLCEILLSMNLSPAQRGKVNNCVNLIKE